jgi:hypothetical protein
MTVLTTGIVFGESPRWHDGRVWLSDWGAHQVIVLTPGGGREVVATVTSFPMCIDFLPDGRLLVVDSARRRLLRREPDGSLVTHADLAPISDKPWNDIVVDAGGNAYVNSIGFDFPGGEPAPGFVVRAARSSRPSSWTAAPSAARSAGTASRRSTWPRSSGAAPRERRSRPARSSPTRRRPPGPAGRSRRHPVPPGTSPSG